jgi:hypothetical protein
MGVQPELRDSLFISADDRSNFKQIIAKRSDLVQFSGGRLAPSMTPGYYNAGLVLGYATSGADAGFYKTYNSANSDGSQVAVAILSEDANVQGTSSTVGNGSEVVVIRATANLFKDLLIGLDSNAITNLGAKSFVEHGVNILYIP